MSMSLLALAVTAWFCRDAGKKIQTTLLLLMAIMAAASFCFKAHKKLPDLLAGEYIQSWNVYHYYIGAKYFNELGYHDIYEQTLVADREGPGRLSHIENIRSLTNYRTDLTNYYLREENRDFEAPALLSL